MSTSTTAQVGPFTIEVSSGHIYLAKNLPQTYDYVPWNILAAVIAEAGLTDLGLIDVGANVGDSLAHFRRFSANRAICVEPSPAFFSILERNAPQFGDVTLVNKLLVPDALRGRVAFACNQQTGSSRVVDAPEQAWTGDTVTFDELGLHRGPWLVKSDTDGFDAAIVSFLLDTIAPNFGAAPIVFFEGPADWQMRTGALDEWFAVLARLQASGYELLLLTNPGRPYVFAGLDQEVARSALVTLQMGYAHGHALFEYYDVIAVHASLQSRFIRMQTPWPDAIFRR